MIRGTVNLNDTETFFVRNGDIVGRIAVFVSGLLLLYLLMRISLRGRKPQIK